MMPHVQRVTLTGFVVRRLRFLAEDVGVRGRSAEEESPWGEEEEEDKEEPEEEEEDAEDREEEEEEEEPNEERRGYLGEERMRPGEAEDLP